MQMNYGGVDLTPYLMVEQIRRELLPSRDIKTTKIPGVPGVKFMRQDSGAKHIEVDIRIIEDDLEKMMDVARVVAGYLDRDVPEKLILRDDTTRYTNSILEGRTWIEKLLTTGGVTLNFVCPDPHTYNVYQNNIALTKRTPIYNSGNAPTPASLRIKINYDVEFLEVSLDKTGERIHIDRKLKGGDIILIDLENESVRLNDELIMKYITLSSDFFKIPPGFSVIHMSSGAGSITFEARWR